MRFYILYFTIFSLMIIGCYHSENPEPTINKIEINRDTNYFDLNPSNVYREIMKADIKFSEIVLRQSIIESGWYTSHNCLERNNLFGMKGGEKTKDNPHGYKIYKNWVESIKAYKEWQSKRLTPDVSNYYQFLVDHKYHQSPDYQRKCEGINLVIVKN